jgi:hypothetical protein
MMIAPHATYSSMESDIAILQTSDYSPRILQTDSLGYIASNIESYCRLGDMVRYMAEHGNMSSSVPIGQNTKDTAPMPIR